MLIRLKYGHWPWWLAICVLALPLTASAADHLVHIGLNNQLQFTDAQSGTNVTVVRPGDTVTWQWDYVGIEHSSTSGTCPQNNCVPDNIWDSGLRFNPPPPPTFTRQFNTLGTFPYFCRIHGPIGMRGKVVVLSGPDYELDIANNSFTFPPSPIPVMNTVAGQPVNFSGTTFGFLGYSNLVNLSCKNGSPRNPDNCPAQNVTPDPSGAPVNFNFSVGDSQAGTYLFDITGIGTDAGMISHSQQVELQVMDFGMTQPTPATVSAVPGALTPTMDFQVSSLGGLNSFIPLSCTLPASLPPGACIFTQNGSFIGGVSVDPNFSPIAHVNVTINPGSSAGVGIYPVQIVGSFSFFNGTTFVNVNHTQTVTIRIIPADHLSVQAPAQVTSGTSFNLTVTAADGAGKTVANYGQIIHFTSSDASIASPPLPADYTFVPGIPGDGGTHSFPITLTNIGPLTITVTDTAVFHENGRSPVILVNPSTIAGTLTIISSRAATAPPHFRDTAVTFTAKVTLNSGSPSGSVAFFDGATPLGPATLGPATGQTATATLTVQALTIGDHVITAVYQPSSGTGAVGSISQPRSPAPRCSGDRCP